jgi:ribonuclease T2
MFLLILFSLSSAYDDNSLIIQWKPTVCKLSSCTSGYLSTDFNIVGLWPQFWDGSSPTFCSNSTFNITSQTQDLLQIYWLSSQGNPQGFWEHEWLKRGTCVSPALTCDVYFNTTVNIFVARNILKILSVFGIVPSTSATYTVNQFIGAFTRTPIVGCSRLGNVYYLNEVKFCYDASFTWISCKGTQGTCGNGFMLIPAN